MDGAQLLALDCLPSTPVGRTGGRGANDLIKLLWDCLSGGVFFPLLKVALLLAFLRPWFIMGKVGVTVLSCTALGG